jgi:hypothetical protein
MGAAFGEPHSQTAAKSQLEVIISTTAPGAEVDAGMCSRTGSANDQNRSIVFLKRAFGLQKPRFAKESSKNVSSMKWPPLELDRLAGRGRHRLPKTATV